jgi:hypothetical protein
LDELEVQLRTIISYASQYMPSGISARSTVLLLQGFINMLADAFELGAGPIQPRDVSGRRLLGIPAGYSELFTDSGHRRTATLQVRVEPHLVTSERFHGLVFLHFQHSPIEFRYLKFCPPILDATILDSKRTLEVCLAWQRLSQTALLSREHSKASRSRRKSKGDENKNNQPKGVVAMLVSTGEF